MPVLKLLILGGSGEAAALARALHGDARYDVTVSLAGQTTQPVPLPGTILSGGFGGAKGLADALVGNTFDALIDATHPFAAAMKRNAVEAARRSGVAFLAVRRPPWSPGVGDRWTMVASLEDAAAALGQDSRRVFLTTGRLELAPFRQAPQHVYVLRSVEAPAAEDLPPLVELVTARGPFRLDDELRLLQEHGIETIVTKNSGGAGAAAKLEAARARGLPVIMVERSALPQAPAVETVEEALDWLHRLHDSTSSA
jgi:precorrin-6A/cobalt-precorrin-6A reductase